MRLQTSGRRSTFTVANCKLDSFVGCAHEFVELRGLSADIASPANNCNDDSIYARLLSFISISKFSSQFQMHRCQQIGVFKPLDTFERKIRYPGPRTVPVRDSRRRPIWPYVCWATDQRSVAGAVCAALGSEEQQVAFGKKSASDYVSGKPCDTAQQNTGPGEGVSLHSKKEHSLVPITSDRAQNEVRRVPVFSKLVRSDPRTGILADTFHKQQSVSCEPHKLLNEPSFKWLSTLETASAQDVAHRGKANRKIKGIVATVNVRIPCPLFQFSCIKPRPSNLALNGRA